MLPALCPACRCLTVAPVRASPAFLPLLCSLPLLSVPSAALAAYKKDAERKRRVEASSAASAIKAKGAAGIQPKQRSSRDKAEAK